MGNKVNFGWKGGCVVRGMIYVMLFVILLIWVYYKNFDLTF